ncbi:MAG: hypothetical protein RLY16_1026, partial [Bacteroidota bacterium]
MCSFHCILHNLNFMSLNNDSIKTRFEALTGARWLFASMVFVYHNRKYWRDKIPGELLR